MFRGLFTKNKEHKLEDMDVKKSEKENPGVGIPQAWIKEVTFSDGSIVEFAQTDIVIFVGANNSGKSASLKDIGKKFDHSVKDTNVVKEIKIDREGSVDDVKSWLKRTATKDPDDANRYDGMSGPTSLDIIHHLWKDGSHELRSLGNFFLYHVSTESRLTAANPPDSIALTSSRLTHPIHYLQKDDSLENELSEKFKVAFGMDLILHRGAGQNVPLYCGKKPSFDPGEDRVSRTYIEKLEADLEELHKQGDGMRSFVGVLLHSQVVSHSVVMIDEPEAFLHPPQARVLGQLLAQETQPNRQIFIATHSSDLIQGMLDSNSEKVRIIRLERDGNINNVQELNNQGIKKLWTDPILRYSNILDGLFHQKVIVCEADSDCRFYAAIFNALFDSEKGRVQKPDIMFTHCGGKDRIPSVVNSLKALGVSVAVVCDLDVLNGDKTLSKIYEGLGGDWESIKHKWKLVKDAVEQKKAELDSKDIIEQIRKALDDISGKSFSSSDRKKIDDIMKQSSPWSLIKRGGSAFIPSGDPTLAYTDLMKDLKKQGVYVVDEGELEGFDRSVGNHGPKWVNEVLTKDLLRDGGLSQARRFVREITKF